MINASCRREAIATLVVAALAISVLFLAPAAAVGARAPRGLHDSRQLVVVTTADWSAVPGRLQRFERSRPGKRWKRAGDPVAIVVGKTGLAWGLGLAPTVDPSIRSALDPVKKEGDGRSPAGAFRIGATFGYAADKPPQWTMPYIALTPTIECVDDTASRYYNQIVDRSTVTPDWSSSEHMAATGQYYRWGAVVDHNVNPATPGDGSCIFLHIWGGPASSTVGCTAMAAEDLTALLAWLNPADAPILVQLPRSQYKKLRKPWHLPRLPKAF